LKSMLQSHHVPEFVVTHYLDTTRKVLLEYSKGDMARLIQDFIDSSISGIRKPSSPPISLEAESVPYYELAWRYLKTLLAGDRQQSRQIITSAIQNGVGIPDVYVKVIQPCLYEIGRLWQDNKINVTQEHYFSAATLMIMSQLYPLMTNERKNGD
jgi:methanogenic corrinoid protein MtbC1